MKADYLVTALCLLDMLVKLVCYAGEIDKYMYKIYVIKTTHLTSHPCLSLTARLDKALIKQFAFDIYHGQFLQSLLLIVRCN